MDDTTTLNEILAQRIGEAAKDCKDTDLLDLVLKLLISKNE